MKAFFAILILSSVAFAEINSSGVVGFQAWRAARIEEARSALTTIQAEAQIDKPQAVRPLEAKKKYQQYQQAQLNLQVAQELSISDYFTLYLSTLKDRSMMLDAARKLSPDEIADLMMAYQKALSTTTAGGADMSLPLLARPKAN